MTKSNAAQTAVPDLPAQARLYEPLPGVYDEMTGSGRTIGPVWQPYANWFATTDAATQGAHAQMIEQLVFEHFFDPQRDRHPWRLDLMPLILASEDWDFIERAAQQRARLYNVLLRDLYGEQRVLTEGLLPAALLHNDASFLRPLRGVMPSQGHLTFLALDFARDPSGDWRIIDTHTETPAGHGFALANRMVLSEVAGSLFRQTNALRVAPFYQGLMDDLMARAGVEDPHIVVLAPGPKASAFVGHAYMARYMSQKRVEGSDLRVVGNRVFLKTIDGLKKVDLVVRAIEGHLADPLELAPHGFDGPVGLVEACRQNPDIIVNALGTAVVENRGLSGYLGALSQRLLGEDIVLHDTPRVWLGEKAARDRVLADLDSYVIHSTQEGTGSPGEAAPGRSARLMSPKDRAGLESEIRFRGSKLVAERAVGFATAPAWTPEGLKPEPYALRVYVSSIGGDFSVMPGGIALSVDTDGSTVALTSAKARSRDVWVVSDKRILPNISLKRLAAHNASIRRQAPGLQSRTADNLFWLGRYAERADGTLRIVRQVLYRSAADLLSLAGSPRPGRTLQAFLEVGTLDAGLPGSFEGDADAMWSALHEVCSSTDRLNGLPRTLGSIRDIAVQCRDRLSGDSWRILTGLSAEPLTRHMRPAFKRDEAGALGVTEEPLLIIEAAEQLIDRFSAFGGLTHENMTRNPGWQFLDLGRRIERAHQLATLLLSMFETAAENELAGDDMIFALQAADSFITFRSRYRFAPELHLVLDLLVIDETNPRSLAYQLAAISDHLGRLPKASGDAVRAPDQRMALELLTKVRLADVEALAEVGKDGRRVALAALFSELIRALPRLTELVSRQYFSLADEQLQRLHAQSARP